MHFVLRDATKSTQKYGKYIPPREKSWEEWYPGGKLTYPGGFFFLSKTIYPGAKSTNSCFRAEKVMGGGEL